MTSREKIVEAALALAAAEPTTNISVVAIARKLGIAPMAIYNYFPSRDALMQELSAQLLSTMEIDSPAEASPFEVLENWAQRTREHFLRYPELLQILGYDNGYASAAWLMASRDLYCALGELGYAQDSLAHAIRWFWNAVMSAITVEIRESLATVAITNDTDARLDGGVRKIADMLSNANADQSLFDFHLCMAIKALKADMSTG